MGVGGDRAPLPPPHRRCRRPRSDPPIGSGAGGSPIRALIVDDNPNDRALIRREVLGLYPDAEVTEIADRPQLDAALASGRGPSLVLTDCVLGWADGVEIVERVRAAHPDCPVIMVSGPVDGQAVVEAMRRGLDDAVLKTPGGPSGLGARIAAALDRRRRRETLREAESRYRHLFQSAPVGLCRCALDGTFLEGNPALVRLLGLGGDEELRALRLPDVLEDRELFERNWARAGDDEAPAEARLLRRDGTRPWALLRLHRVRTADGIEVLEGAVTDITERRQAEQRLEALLREKSVLLEELYHRVNNNLQLVLTFVNMLIDRTADPGTRRRLEDLGSRIVSIALVQEQLYRGGSYAEVDLRSYLRELTDSLLSGTGTAVELALDGLVVPIGQAIAVGLIANELLINCVKHAFPGVADPKIRVTLRRLEGGKRGVLVVEDNGIGIPRGDLAGHERVGYRLIRALVRQAEGTLEVGQGGGTTVRLEFPLRTSAP